MTGPAAAERAERGFEERFGRAPQWLAAAPGRVNLIGEHTDYNDGFVLPMAIDRRTVIAGGPSADGGQIRIVSEQEPVPVRFDPSVPIGCGEPRWGNYCRGVAAGFQALNTPLPALDAFVASDVPSGGGLSSSAALEVAFATLLEAAAGTALDPVDKALLCLRAENEFAGLPCGIMDPFAVTLGRAGRFLLIDCRSRSVDYVPLADPGLTVLIINTCVRHELTGGEYALRRRQCESAARALGGACLRGGRPCPPAAGAPGVASLRAATPGLLESRRELLDDTCYRRARHVISENGRTLQAAEALRAADWGRLGALMDASHASLRDDFEVSCAELDAVADIASGLGPGGGVLGCRMTGGGFGGCAVALVRTDAAGAAAAAIGDAYRGRTGVTPALFVTSPSAGAGLVPPTSRLQPTQSLPF